MKSIKSYIQRWSAGLVLTGALTGCYVTPSSFVAPVTPPAVTTTTPSAGTADFTKFVSIGNSITAGYANGGVYRAGQLVAYPNLLAQQFKYVGGGDFALPLYSEAQKDGTGYLYLASVPAPLPDIRLFAPGSTGFMSGYRQLTPTQLYAKHTGANQNFGVAGIRVDNVNIPGYGALNPHYERLLADADVNTKTYRQYVMDNSAGATFFSLWLGNNDALGYAMTGATGATPFKNTLTDLATFQANYTTMLDMMTGSTPAGLAISKGVLVSIPNVTSLPYFRTITTASLLAEVKKVNSSITTIYIETSGGARAATANDLFLLGESAEYKKIGTEAYVTGVPYGLHPLSPIKTSVVLDSDEVTAINTRIGEYNTFISAQATARGLAYFNANALMTTASATGYLSGAVLYKSDFITGGVFGLDGVHLTPAGNAIIANEIIKTINAKYTSTIPLLNPNLYPGVLVTRM